MSDLAEKKKHLKDMIRRLHGGADPESIKEEFAQVLEGVAPSEIAAIEEELIREGMDKSELQRLCDVHLAIFKETLESQKIEAEPGHPVYILLREHDFVKKVVGKISDVLSSVESGQDFSEGAVQKMKELLGHLREYEKHKVREENTLFPSLEKHGVTGPPSIMWAEHDEQRKRIKAADKTLESGTPVSPGESMKNLISDLKDLTSMIPNHFYKEENILFPTALKILSDDEWKEIKISMDDLGYCNFTPQEAIGKKEAMMKKVEKKGDMVAFDTGTLSEKELEAMLNSLPVDITFVDSNDTVRYFSQTKDRIFPRAKTIIGRKVQQCHPQKSIHAVNQILEDFRNGRRENAEFWIKMGEKTVYIRYFPVRDDAGSYLGCLEVTQDIAPIKKLEGEKRLL
jgi:PAS domain S-box-containing protein